MSIIRDINLHEHGRMKIDWVKKNMPLLNSIEADFSKSKCLSGIKIAMCIHVEAKTAYLAEVLKAAGADVRLTGCNPLSTQDDVAAALAKNGLEVFAWHGATVDEYNCHLKKTLEFNPDIFLDDGGDVTNLLHDEFSSMEVWGGSEETTTGIHRLHSREKAGKLRFPVVSVNDADCKHLFDNRYGTGQSVWNAINKTTNLIVAGKNVVIAGYGWCGKGCAMRAKGLGANVIVCEIDPIKAIEAVMDGFRVMTMNEASKIGDIFVTVTGCERVIHKEHYKNMKDGVILSNAGHFDVEVNIPELKEMATEVKCVRDNVMGYKMPDGRWINVLAEGRLVNLASGDGHPAEIMDMSFAIQALTMKYIAEHHNEMTNKVYDVPKELDNYVANLKLATMGITIDKLTDKQAAYLNSAAH
ncbi:MAG: adenosylhomocysteinase [Clostridia bacterium]|nr:adenosylhomocysteinase [Clostridia bacterium]